MLQLRLRRFQRFSGRPAGRYEGNHRWNFASVPRAQLVKHYTPLQAFCIMLFCLLSIPCLATLAIIKRELNSWKMAFVEAGALFALAYVATLIVYQLGSVLEIGTRMLQ